MKIDPRFYQAQIESGADRATVFCLTYHLGPSLQFSGADFYEVVWATDRQFTIPNSRLATFQEELRTLHQAVAVFDGDRSREENVIRSKLEEAYGSNATIHIEEIQAKPKAQT